MVIAVLLLSTLTPVGFLPSSAQAAASGLEINEIMAGPARDWDGSGTFSSRDDEWVEVRNAGPSSLDLSPFLITGGDSIPRFAFTGVLGPGERRVIYGKESFDWEHANGFPAFGLSLSNSGDAVVLWRVENGDTTVVDAYTYRSHEAAADRAVGRANDTGEWSLFDGLNPYTGTMLPAGTGCAPTPGALNLCGLTPTRSPSWARLKAIYR
jgi:hypothetical protein